MKPPRSTAFAALATALVLLLGAGIHCEGTTGDHRVRFHGTVRGAGRDGVTAAGWVVHFDRFVAAFGPVRIYADPAFASAERRHAPNPCAPSLATRPPLRRASLLGRLSLGVALAQHCHGCPRAPLAEFGFERGAAVDRAVDLLEDSPFNLGPANARNGVYRSVSFTFRSPITPANAGPAATELAGHTMSMRGTATRGDETVPFEGTIDLQTQDQVAPLAPGSRPYTTFGVPFDNPDGVALESTNEMLDHVAIRVDLVRLFDQADFSRLPPPAALGGARSITADSQVHTAWRLGVENPNSFRVGWVGQGGHGEPPPRSASSTLDAGR